MKKVCARKTTKADWGRYIMVTLMLFISATPCFFFTLSPGIAYLFFLFVSFFFFLHSKKENKLEVSGSSLYILIFIFVILLNVFIFNPNVTTNKWQGEIVGALGAYFFYSSFSFRKFKIILLDILSFITLLSIIVFLADSIGILPFVRQVQIHNVNYIMFFIFNLGWETPFGRMASIWHEPGACQIFLNMVILLYLDEIKQGRLSSAQWKKIIIIVLGVLCTQSTSGYLVLMLMSFYLLYPWIKKMRIYYKTLLIVIYLFSFAFLLTSDVVRGKLEQDIEETTSLGVRARDNIACVEMAITRPFTGYGINTIEYSKQSYNLDNLTSSNGLLATCASLGIWWLCLYVYFMIKALKKMPLQIPISFSVLIILLLESNESYIDLPISYWYIVRFLDYKN